MTPPLAFGLEAPAFLVLLLLIPAGLWASHAARAQRRRRAIRMPATSTLKAVAAAQPSHRRWLPIALLAADPAEGVEPAMEILVGLELMPDIGDQCGCVSGRPECFGLGDVFAE